MTSGDMADLLVLIHGPFFRTFMREVTTGHRIEKVQHKCTG